MKKFIIAALLTVSSTMTFAAEQASVNVNGKKITVDDTRASLIKKLGKPASGSNAYSNWMVNGLSIYAGYNQYGVNELNIVKLNSTPVSVTIDGKTITLGKDSIRSAAGKIKAGCYNFDEGRQGSTYSYITRAGAEGEYDIAFDTESDASDLKTIANQPINGLRIGYDGFDANKGCTQ
jgi:hypothetical protein